MRIHVSNGRYEDERGGRAKEQRRENGNAFCVMALQLPELAIATEISSRHKKGACHLLTFLKENVALTNIIDHRTRCKLCCGLTAGSRSKKKWGMQSHPPPHPSLHLCGRQSLLLLFLARRIDGLRYPLAPHHGRTYKRAPVCELHFPCIG